MLPSFNDLVCRRRKCHDEERVAAAFFGGIGMLQPGLSDDEKDNVSYFPVPCIIYVCLLTS